MIARRALLALVVALLALTLSHATGPARAIAAFELRDASPPALGAVSLDREADPLFEDDARRGLGVRASHAALYGVEGLTSEQVAVSFRTGALRLDLSQTQVGVPGIREGTTRLSMREGGERAVTLSLTLERLVLALEDEPPGSVWALGAGVRGRAVVRGIRGDVSLGADRIVRRGEPGRDAVTPALPWSVRLRSGGASLEIADRWEGDGRTSPRLSFDLRAGGALALRFARGERPGRTGAAAALRVGRIEVSVGRQDDELGGTVSAMAVALLPGGPKR